MASKKWMMIGIVAIVALLVLCCANKGKGLFEGFSGAFDPSLRNPTGQIGPLQSNQEGFCGSCV